MSSYGIKNFKGLNMVADPSLLDELGNSCVYCNNLDVSSGQLRPYGKPELIESKYVTSQNTVPDYWVSDDSFGFYNNYFRHSYRYGSHIYDFNLFPDLGISNIYFRPNLGSRYATKLSLSDTEYRFDSINLLKFELSGFPVLSELEYVFNEYSELESFRSFESVYDNIIGLSVNSSEIDLPSYYVDYSFNFFGLRFNSDLKTMSSFIYSNIDSVKDVSAYTDFSSGISSIYDRFKDPTSLVFSTSKNIVDSSLSFQRYSIDNLIFFQTSSKSSFDNRVYSFNDSYIIPDLDSADKDTCKNTVVSQNDTVYPQYIFYRLVAEDTLAIYSNIFSDGIIFSYFIPYGSKDNIYFRSSNNPNTPVKVSVEYTADSGSGVKIITFKYEDSPSNVEQIVSPDHGDNLYYVQLNVDSNSFYMDPSVPSTINRTIVTQDFDFRPEVDLGYTSFDVKVSSPDMFYACDFNLKGLNSSALGGFPYDPLHYKYDSVVSTVVDIEFPTWFNYTCFIVLDTYDNSTHKYTRARILFWLKPDLSTGTFFQAYDISSEINTISSKQFRICANFKKTSESNIDVIAFLYIFDESTKKYIDQSSSNTLMNLTIPDSYSKEPTVTFGNSSSSSLYNNFIYSNTLPFSNFQIDISRFVLFNKSFKSGYDSSDILNYSYGVMGRTLLKLPLIDDSLNKSLGFMDRGYLDYTNIYRLYNGEVYLEDSFHPTIASTTITGKVDSTSFNPILKATLKDNYYDLTSSEYQSFIFDSSNLYFKNSSDECYKYVGDKSIKIYYASDSDYNDSIVFKSIPSNSNEIELVSSVSWELLPYDSSTSYLSLEDPSLLSDIYDGSFESSITGNEIIYTGFPEDLDGISAEPYAGMSIAWKGSTLYWSETLEPTKWANEFSTLFPSNIMGVVVGSESLTIITEHSTHATTDKNPETISFYDVANVGALNSKCVNTYQGQPLFMSNTGILLFSGGSYRNLTKDIFPRKWFANPKYPSLGSSEFDVFFTLNGINVFRLDIVSLSMTYINVEGSNFPQPVRVKFFDSYSPGSVYTVSRLNLMDALTGNNLIIEMPELLDLSILNPIDPSSNEFVASLGSLDLNVIDFQNFDSLYVKGKTRSELFVGDTYGDALVGEYLYPYDEPNINYTLYYNCDVPTLDNLILPSDNVVLLRDIADGHVFTSGDIVRFFITVGGLPYAKYRLEYLGTTDIIPSGNEYNFGPNAIFDETDMSFRSSLWKILPYGVDKFVNVLYDSDGKIAYPGTESSVMTNSSGLGRSTLLGYSDPIPSFYLGYGIIVCLDADDNIVAVQGDSDKTSADTSTIFKNGVLQDGWKIVDIHSGIDLDLKTEYGSLVGLPFDRQLDCISVILKGSNIINGIAIKGY